MASTALSSPFLVQGAAGLASSRSSVHGSSLPLASPKISAPSFAPVSKLQCRAEKSDDSVSVPRRLALALLAGSFVAGSKISPASAAYGEAANVFGSPKQQSGFTVYKGDGFKLEVPSKWNPSKEREFPGTVLRYEDNFDAKSNLSVIIQPTDKPSIKDYGGPEKFLDEVKYLLGKQVYTGKTASEGGFDANAVSTAALLESKSKDVNGETYYDLDILTRTADGDEGGTHQRIVATVKGGKLYLLKAQAGDKRWFKGAQKFIKGVADSFALA